MILSDLSIRRPVLAWVMNLVIVLIGIICYQRLAVRLIPNVDVPVVTVATGYPGANAQVIESQITKPIEDALSGIEGIDFIQSVSRAESSQVTVSFKLNRDPDAAASDVRDRHHHASLQQRESPRREAHRIGVAIGSVAVKQAGSGAVGRYIGPSNQRDRHSGAVKRHGLESLGDKAAGVIATDHLLLLDQGSLARLQVVVEDRSGCDEGLVPNADGRQLPFRIGVEVGLEGRLRKGDAMSGGVAQATHGQLRDSILPLTDQQVPGKAIVPLEHDGRAMGHDLLKRRALDIRHGCSHEAKVPSDVVDPKVEVIAEVIDVILDIGLTR